MCRNIKTLANFEPPATDEEIRASALQFVRKLSGSSRPSKANEAIFNRAVDEVTEIAERLIAHSRPTPRHATVRSKQRRQKSVRASDTRKKIPANSASRILTPA